MKQQFTAICTAISLIAGICLATASPVVAQDEKSLFGIDTGSVTYGRYFKAELGMAVPAFDSGNWHPPGPSDPQVFFDLSNENAAYGSIAMGYDWQNGYRGDVSLSMFGGVTSQGPWSYTVPTIAGPHASVSAKTSTIALMATGYYSPLEHKGNNRRVQPYLSVGVGLASNNMGDWTRVEPIGSTSRAFEGKSSIDLAWSVGFGVAFEKKREKGKTPLLLEVGYRYFDLGTAKGGTTPISSGRAPIEAFNFNNRQHVFSIGLRIPLEKY